MVDDGEEGSAGGCGFKTGSSIVGDGRSASISASISSVVWGTSPSGGEVRVSSAASARTSSLERKTIYSVEEVRGSWAVSALALILSPVELVRVVASAAGRAGAFLQFGLSFLAVISFSSPDNSSNLSRFGRLFFMRLWPTLLGIRFNASRSSPSNCKVSRPVRPW